MDYWAKAPLRRDQILLFSPTLDDSISDDHPVRLLDEILRAQDWSAWERHYDGRRGQPPIPPWVMAGVILCQRTHHLRVGLWRHLHRVHPERQVRHDMQGRGDQRLADRFVGHQQDADAHGRSLAGKRVGTDVIAGHSSSRWNVSTLSRRARKCAASCSTRYTDRCRPPVQPTEMVT